jgi:hypothetical protein
MSFSAPDLCKIDVIIKIIAIGMIVYVTLIWRTELFWLDALTLRGKRITKPLRKMNNLASPICSLMFGHDFVISPFYRFDPTVPHGNLKIENLQKPSVADGQLCC